MRWLVILVLLTYPAHAEPWPNGRPYDISNFPKWLSVLGRSTPIVPKGGVDSINAYFNAAQLRPDKTTAAPWGTPHDLMTIGGDCEEFAIAKFLALRSKGIEARFVVVWDLDLNSPHAFVMAKSDKWVKLDIRETKNYDVIYTLTETQALLY